MIKNLNGVKAIILDLDDTLYDCSGTLIERGRRHAAKTLAKIINCTEDEAYSLQLEIEEEHGTRANVYEKIVTYYNLPKHYKKKLLEEFIYIDISNITLFSDVVNTLLQLKRQGYQLILVTSGEDQIQRKKINVLGINGDYFNDILIAGRNSPPTKEDHFKDILHRYSLKPEEVICIGDKIDDELAAGKSLGITTIMFQHGRHYQAYLKEPEKHIKPDLFIKCIKDILYLLPR